MQICFYLEHLLYLTAFIASLIYSFGEKEKTRRASGLVTIFTLFLAWLLQGILFALAFSQSGTHTSYITGSGLVIWGIALSFMLLSVSTKLLRTAWIFTGTILIISLFSLKTGTDATLLLDLDPKLRIWGSIHLSTSFIGFAALLVQALIALLYLLKEYSLKTKRFAMIEGIPPLDRLAYFSDGMLWIGFLLLTAGLLSGGGWSKLLYGRYLTDDPREAMTLLSWIAYAILVNVRSLPRFKGRRVMALSLLAFALLSLSLRLSHTA